MNKSYWVESTPKTNYPNISKDINTDVLISEAIIVGDVPDTYYNLEGMDETEDTYNFIE